MKKINPPRLAQTLFDWYCGLAKVEDLRGDMDEIFLLNVKRKGVFKARVFYWRQVISLLFSYALQKRKEHAALPAHALTSALPLLGNYVKVAARNLARQKYFTAINIAGLAIGMSISLLFITLFISVTDYDEFHVNKESIYRITTHYEHKHFASAPRELAERIKSDYPAISNVTRVGRSLYTQEPQERQQISLAGFFVDPSFLEMFTFPLEAGDARTALTDPHSILITRKAATKVFGDADPLGKTLMMGGHGNYIVKGVVADYPANSHLQFDVLAPYPVSEPQSDVPLAKQWTSFANEYVYVSLRDGSDAAGLQQYVDRVAHDVFSATDSPRPAFELQALKDVTPGPELENQIGPQWSYLSFMIAGGLALLILLPACFNYANISIARAMKRAKEIGLRKTFGSARKQIFLQFVTETVLVTLLSLAGACLIFFVIRDEFRSMMVHAAALDLSLTWNRLIWFIVFAVITGLLAGAFPAIHFSRLNPIEAIRNSGGANRVAGSMIRKTLIVFQFALCLSFILSLVIFGKQYRYALNFDLGFQRENILDVDLQQVQPDILAAEFTKNPAVQAVSMSSGIMGHGVPGAWTTLDGKSDSAQVYYMFIDQAFLRNMEVELLAGRNFDMNESPNSSVIVNQSFVKRFGFAGPSEAIGQRITADSTSIEVIGVIRDFHFWQLHAPVAPFMFRYNPEKLRVANLKISTTDIQATLLSLDRSWRKVAGDRPFVANFLDDETTGAFGFYVSLLKICGFLGLLAISVSCLGLLGMVIFTAETKTKEVGIRKVMGASVASITLLLARDYLKLMLIASLFAIPVAFGIEKFLAGMQYYRVTITVFDILAGLLAMFALGVGTMASQTIRAASANPAKTLKYE